MVTSYKNQSTYVRYDNINLLARARVRCAWLSSRSYLQWRTEGFWRPGRKWELAPLLRRVRLASAKALSLAIRGLGRSPSHQRFWDLGAIWSEWNPFLNSVNTIFIFRVRLASAFGALPLSLAIEGLGRSPDANAFGQCYFQLSPGGDFPLPESQIPPPPEKHPKYKKH